MGYASLLMCVTGGGVQDSYADAVLSFAQSHQAKVSAIYAINPVPPYLLTADYLPPPMTAEYLKDEEELEQKSRALVETRAKALGMSIDWHLEHSLPLDGVCRHSPYYDLITVPAGTDITATTDGSGLPAELVMSVGNPVMIIPPTTRSAGIGKRVLIAWKPSREATRAIHDALPLLRQAEKVTVLKIGVNANSTSEDADKLVSHLAAHGVRSETLFEMADGRIVGSVVLDVIQRLNCDLLVMGGYGHSRLRELLLGGVTRHVLRHLSIPVFMSH